MDVRSGSASESSNTPLCAPVGVGRFFPVNSYWRTGIGCCFPGTKVCYVLRGSQHRFRRTAGHGGATVMPTTSAGSANRPAMGRRSGDITIAQTEKINGLLVTAVVLPPDSEVVAPIELTGGPLGTCAFIVPSRQLTEDFGVVVGHTLVDESTCSANILMINPNAEEVVLPCKTCVGKLVPISAVSVGTAVTNGWCWDTARTLGGHCKGVPPLVGGIRLPIASRLTISI